MKRLVKNILIFLLPLSLVFLVGFFMPPTPRAAQSLLFAATTKDSLLKNTAGPRVIFIGGSNLSFGLNSQAIKDSLQINPINTSIHANIGLKYMLSHTLPFVKNNDAVVVAAEYSHFYNDYNGVSDELFRTLVDVGATKNSQTSTAQWFDMLGYIPRYALTKFKPSEYFNYDATVVYNKNAFNVYGDVAVHWNLPKKNYTPIIVQGNFNKAVIEALKDFELQLKSLGATLYISFPCLDEVSFDKSVQKINLVEQQLIQNNFKLLGNAVRYKMPKQLMYDACYHLTKEGVDRRTKLLIEDIKRVK
jgi:hypothetical protein